MPTLDPTLEQQRQELANLVRRHAPGTTCVESAIEDLYLVRYEESVRSSFGVSSKRIRRSRASSSNGSVRST